MYLLSVIQHAVFFFCLEGKCDNDCLFVSSSFLDNDDDDDDEEGPRKRNNPVSSRLRRKQVC